jgi:hypothetical protein
MGERPPAVTEEDQNNQSNQSEGSLQLSKTFEAIARKDEEIMELKEEVEKLRKQSSVGLTPTEEVLSLRGSLKDVMLKVRYNTRLTLLNVKKFEMPNDCLHLWFCNDYLGSRTSSTGRR